MPKLIVEKGPDKGKELVLKEGQNVVIGREQSVHFVVNDPMSSRKHCLVGIVKGTWLLKDLNSANGTFASGRQIASGKAIRLNEGDSFQIGETLISFVGEEAEGESDPFIGKVIGGCRIDRLLGRGAMGVVYSAHQLSLGRDVAFKLLSGALNEDKRFTDMFIKEARAAAALNHPNVLQVFDVGEDNGRFFMSMEIADGGSVLEELRAAGRIDLDRTLEIMQDSLSALDYAAKKDIVHRDIKPDNLMLTADGVVKLGDLGLAASAAELATGQSGVFGTPHYIAPEQAMGKPVDKRADIYALGATWYRLLSGQTLFTGGNVREILRKQVREPHTPLKQILSDIPVAISKIVDKMLAKDPDKRYHDAGEVLDDIDSFIANRHASADALAKRQRQAVVTEGKKSNLVVIGVIVGLVLLGGGIALAVALSGSGSDGNNTNIAENANTDPGSNNGKTGEGLSRDELHASTALERAKLKQEYDGMEAASPDFKAIITSWPDTEAAQEAQRILAEWEKEFGAIEAERAALVEEWEASVKKGEEELVPRYKIHATLSLLDEVMEKIRTSPHERVSMLETDDAMRQQRIALIQQAELLIRQELARIQQGLVGVDRLDHAERIPRFDTAIQAAQAFLEEIDDPTYERGVTAAISDWERRRSLAEDALAEQARNARLQAASKTAQAFRDVLVPAINEELQAFDFAGAESRFTRFEEKDQGLQTYGESDEFSSIRSMLADRKKQTELEKAGLEWLVKNCDTGSSVSLEGDTGYPELEQIFPGAELVHIRVSRGFDEARPAFLANVKWKTGTIENGVKKFFKDIDVRGLAILLHVVRSENAAFEETLQAFENVETTLGLGALLLELNQPMQACDLMSFAYLHYDTVDDNIFAQRLHEYMAYALKSRAAAYLTASNPDAARADLDRLKREFSDTRAYKGLER